MKCAFALLLCRSTPVVQRGHLCRYLAMRVFEGAVFVATYFLLFRLYFSGLTEFPELNRTIFRISVDPFSTKPSRWNPNQRTGACHRLRETLCGMGPAVSHCA